MKRVLVDQDITPIDRLNNQFPDSWVVSVGLSSNEETVRQTFETAHIGLVTSRIPLTRRVIEAAEELEVVGKLGTGIDNVDVEAAREAGVTVTYTPGYNALTVAEHTLGLVLATARRLTEARRLVEDGHWRDEYTLGTQLSGSTVGIVGLGRIGKRVGKLLSGFDVDVAFHDPYVPAIDADLVDGPQIALDDLLTRSEFVVVTAELTEETRGLLGERELSLMRPESILVNTARGPIVEEAALVDALRSGSIGGAGLDVFETEPLAPDSPLLEFENVVLTPHVSSMTTESRVDGIEQLATNVRRILDDRDVSDRYIAAP